MSIPVTKLSGIRISHELNEFNELNSFNPFNSWLILPFRLRIILPGIIDSIIVPPIIQGGGP